MQYSTHPRFRLANTSLLLASLTGTALTQSNAPVTQGNPQMASIQATLFAFNPIQGSITGVSGMNGTGVNFNINFYGFPSTGAPFGYYITSATSIPSTSVCSTLLTPFNPYNSASDLASSSSCISTPATCAIGSLSAKHGAITPTGSEFSFQKFYLDDYLSTLPGSEAYFGGRAIVVADKDGQPVNCALFPGTPVAEAGGSSSASGSGSATMSATGSASATAAMTTAAGGGSSSGTATASAAATTTSSAAAGVGSRLGGSGRGLALVAAVAALVV